jgi:uncharacterized protein (TIGR03086 family)
MSADQMSQLQRCLDFAENIIAGIPVTARQSPTPCPEYDVTALASHLITGLDWFSRIPAEGISDPSTVPDPDLTGKDLLVEFRAVAALVRANWHPTDLERVFVGPFGDLTGANTVNFTMLELLGHGLDLALATGQEARPEDDLLATGQAIAIGMGKMLRGPKMMGSEVTVAEDALLVDRFLGLLGRDPGWRPEPGQS